MQYGKPTRRSLETLSNSKRKKRKKENKGSEKVKIQNENWYRNSNFPWKVYFPLLRPPPPVRSNPDVIPWRVEKRNLVFSWELCSDSPETLRPEWLFKRYFITLRNARISFSFFLILLFLECFSCIGYWLYRWE